MTISFLPGEPNRYPNAVCTVNWDGHRILAYCSGNNLIILQDSSYLIQTIYLNSDGISVSIERESGWLAVSQENTVQIYVPTKRFDKPPKWDKLIEFSNEKDEGIITSLSWGTQHELLTGSNYLNLWDVNETECKKLWSRQLSTQVHTAIFSPDNSFVASIGFYDQNVKIWNRLSFDHDNLDFDFTYLPHNDIVTTLRWRQSIYPNQSIGNTLYTTCGDSYLRIWQPTDACESSTLDLCCEIDLFQGEDHDPKLKRFAFMLDNGDLAKGIENALIRSHDDPSSSMKRITDLAQISPDLCFIITEDKKMNVYTVENLGHKHDKSVSVNAFVKDLNLPSRFPCDARHLTFFSFFNFTFTQDANDTRIKDISIIVHDYRGVLLHYTAFIDRMLDPTITKKHWSLNAVLTGHNKSVQRLFRTADGQNLLSISRFNENYLWKTHKLEESVTLQRRSLVLTDVNKSIKRATILGNGDYLLTILQDCICLWDCTSFNAMKLSEKPLKSTQEASLLFALPQVENILGGYGVVAIYPDKTSHLWKISLPNHKFKNNDDDEMIKSIGTFKLPLEDDMLTAVRVDPVSWNATLNYNTEPDQNVVFATMSPSGVFRSWSASLCKDEIKWIEIDAVETGINNASRVEVSSINKVAITCSTSFNLSIWDMKNQMLEFEQRFESPISDLDWTGTPDSQGILAVGLSTEVILYSQLRFDYTNKTPCWTPVKKIDISMYTTHGIGDSIWLYGGSLAIGAGNQFFITDPEVDITDTNTKILTGSTRDKSKHTTHHNGLFEVCAILNGPLPVYHPQFLIQCLFADKLDMVKYVLVLLLRKIKFGVVLDNNVIDISSNLDLEPEKVLDLMKEKTEKKEQFSTVFTSSVDDLQSFDSSVAEQLQEWLQKVSVPFLTQHQQVTLASVIEGVAKVQENLRSIDANGIKFLLGYRLFLIHRGVQKSMNIRDFNWALHSESQDLLFDLIKGHSDTAFMWPVARDTGVAYWLRTDKLREVFELLARNHFIQNNRDPTKCSLFYLALKKKQVLLGLWRTAAWHKEQVKTMKLLANDFTLEKYKVTAQKNAFALLGKHRYEYAAAFFLLGDSLREAVNVIAKDMNDIPLAIAIARVYGGEDHEAFKGLLQRYILPKAVLEGDRWTTSWAFWRLNDRESSIQALVKSPREILDKCQDSIQLAKEDCEVLDNKSFLVDDPVLIMLYRNLRKQNLKNLLGAVQLKPKEEFNFVIKTASIYRRMGCDILALALVKNWTFILDKAALMGRITVPTSIATTPTSQKDSPNLSLLNSQSGSILDNKKLREAIAARRNSLFGGNAAAMAAFAAAAAAPLPDVSNTSANQGNGLTKTESNENNPFKNFKPAPAVAFKEPDMSAFKFGF